MGINNVATICWIKRTWSYGAPIIQFPIAFAEIPYALEGGFGIENIGSAVATNVTITSFQIAADTRHCTSAYMFIGKS